MSRGVSPSDLCSSPYSKTYADLTSIRDFYTDSGANLSRRIRVGGAGTVQVEYQDLSTDTITYPAGAVDDIVVKRLLSGTATNVTVYQ